MLLIRVLLINNAVCIRTLYCDGTCVLMFDSYLMFNPVYELSNLATDKDWWRMSNSTLLWQKRRGHTVWRRSCTQEGTGVAILRSHMNNPSSLRPQNNMVEISTQKWSLKVKSPKLYLTYKIRSQAIVPQSTEIKFWPQVIVNSLRSQ